MRRFPVLALVLPLGILSFVGLAAVDGNAQDLGTLNARKLPPLTHVKASTPAKQLFGRVLSPSEAATRSIGFYSRGCLAGGVALPVNGPDWQVMRLSRKPQLGHAAACLIP